MTNMTLSVPDDVREKMKRHPELNWSEIARQAFESKLEEIELMEKLLKKSELTEEDAERIGHRIKSRMRRRFAR